MEWRCLKGRWKEKFEYRKQNWIQNTEYRMTKFERKENAEGRRQKAELNSEYRISNDEVWKEGESKKNEVIPTLCTLLNSLIGIPTSFHTSSFLDRYSEFISSFLLLTCWILLAMASFRVAVCTERTKIEMSSLASFSSDGTRSESGSSWSPSTILSPA